GDRCVACCGQAGPHWGAALPVGRPEGRPTHRGGRNDDRGQIIVASRIVLNARWHRFTITTTTTTTTTIVLCLTCS
ncbi:hypothetical protein, partial [uncultured Thiodictyon sp.]|uniref:hypothetical protein n=1 Tax=uncultured Thiodictyon sp. TaxID=1846217 RepID=UPI002600472E